MSNRNAPANASPVPPPEDASGKSALPIAVNVAVAALAAVLLVLLIGRENRVSFPPYVPPAGTVQVPTGEPPSEPVPAAP